MKYIIHNIVKLHTILITMFIVGSIFNFKTPSFVNFYGLELFNQAWDMFSPNPGSHYYKLSFKCFEQDKDRSYSNFGTLLEKQLPIGKYQSILNDTLILLTYKEERIRTKRMRDIDYIVYKEAKDKLQNLLEKKCKKVFKKKITPLQISYTIESYAI